MNPNPCQKGVCFVKPPATFNLEWRRESKWKRNTTMSTKRFVKVTGIHTSKCVSKLSFSMQKLNAFLKADTNQNWWKSHKALSVKTEKSIANSKRLKTIETFLGKKSLSRYLKILNRWIRREAHVLSNTQNRVPKLVLKALNTKSLREQTMQDQGNNFVRDSQVDAGINSFQKSLWWDSPTQNLETMRFKIGKAL